MSTEKVFIRTLKNGTMKCLWYNELEREALRIALNDYGFYTLTGNDDSLDVYAIKYKDNVEDIIIDLFKGNHGK